MSKRIKMCLYGEPGTGKSVFACHAPNSFFITTDGNYEWLEDFGAKEEDHKQVFSWAEAKEAFAQEYDEYDTIVVDLIDDLFKWCEHEFCTKTKITHVSDLGFGKGYDITRNEFFLEISKLLGKDKNIILLSHGYTYTVKDRKGTEQTKHAPSNRVPDKVWDMIEGRMRYFIRCYMKADVTDEDVITKRRMLSLVPKENEFGICRGIDESSIPHDIPLDWDEFTTAIKFSKPKVEESKPKLTEETFDKETVNNDKPTQKIVDSVDSTKEEKPDINVSKSNAEKVEEMKAKLAALQANKNK